MASFNRPHLLSRTLASIRDQRPGFPYEVIVVDDGSEGTGTAEVCQRFGANYFRTEHSEYRNPGPARNIGYKAARGEIIVAQSDDTYHETVDALERLADCPARTMQIATVWELAPDGSSKSQYTGSDNPRPFFFLGSLPREDLYAVGGDDEDFAQPGFDDNWLAARLINGRRLVPIFRGDIVGCHQWHERPPEDQAMPWFHRMKALYDEKIKVALATEAWVAGSGAWPYTEGA
jgi:glycosyltransferase involved in cell wall biosynthesis